MQRKRHRRYGKAEGWLLSNNSGNEKQFKNASDSMMKTIAFNGENKKNDQRSYSGI